MIVILKLYCADSAALLLGLLNLAVTGSAENIVLLGLVAMVVEGRVDLPEGMVR